MTRAVFAMPAAAFGALVLWLRFGELPALDVRPLGWALGVVALGWVLVRVSGRIPVVAGHVHGGTRQRVARHEAGHWVAARAVGGRPTSAVIHAGGGGHVSWTGTSGTDREQVVNAVAFLDAGRRALGSSEGCGGDQDGIGRQLRYLPASERAAARREGEALARRIVSSRAGEIRRVAAQLDERGQL